MNIVKRTYLSDRFFLALAITIVLFAASFVLGILFVLAQLVLLLLLVFTFADGYILFRQKEMYSVKRKVQHIFSLNDPHELTIIVANISAINLQSKVIDEIPYQFQIRNFERILDLKSGEEKNITYNLTPKTRGKYHFGNINIYSKTAIKLISRKDVFALETDVAVYPSIVQMKKYALSAYTSVNLMYGIKKIRRIGHSYEFDHIKNYVRGDDTRAINWKASSRRGELMINHFEDEKSQQVYSIIDKGRNMKMPFNDLSLLDYAINTSLVISNVALQKQDRAGLLSFSDKLGNVIKAEKKSNQLEMILNALYNEKERNLESNYELLYTAIRKIIKGRSLLFLFTNFESIYALERVLPILRKINKFHLLVTIFFKNTTLDEFASKESEHVKDIYDKTIARKFITGKKNIIHELTNHGIQAILTKPEDLSINAVNKYLELKSRGLI